jgi:hypothetical protein
LTPVSLHRRSATCRHCPPKAVTPASTEPSKIAPVHDDSATSTPTSRQSPNQTSRIRQRRSDPPSKVVPVNAHSVNDALAACTSS